MLSSGARPWPWGGFRALHYRVSQKGLYVFDNLWHSTASQSAIYRRFWVKSRNPGQTFLRDSVDSHNWTWPEGSRCLGGCRIAVAAAENGINVEHHSSLSSTELCKTFLPSFDNHSLNVPLPTPKLHYGTLFQSVIPETWQECLYTTLYSFFCPETKVIIINCRCHRMQCMLRFTRNTIERRIRRGENGI